MSESGRRARQGARRADPLPESGAPSSRPPSDDADGAAVPADGRPHVDPKVFARLLLRRSVAEFFDDRCSQFAAAISYHVLFSLFPLAIVFAAIFGLVLHATGVRADVVTSIVDHVPLSADGAASFRRLLEGATSGYSSLGLFGLLGLLYSGSGMMGAIRTALNQAWDVEEARPFLRGQLVDLGLVFAAGLLGLATVGVTVAVRFLSDRLAGGAVWALGVAVPAAVSFGVTLFLYRVVPAARVRVRDAWPGALLAALGFVLAENLFAVYIGHFAHYNAVYGSLGAVIAFMFFVYLAAMIFLFGAEVASEWPRIHDGVGRGGAGTADGHLVTPPS